MRGRLLMDGPNADRSLSGACPEKVEGTKLRWTIGKLFLKDHHAGYIKLGAILGKPMYPYSESHQIPPVVSPGAVK